MTPEMLKAFLERVLVRRVRYKTSTCSLDGSGAVVGCFSSLAEARA